MTRYQAFRGAHLAGHAFWWIFVVSTLLTGGITWLGAEGRDDFGWTAYSPLTSSPVRYSNFLPSHGFVPIDNVSLVAFSLLVLSAIAEAVVVRRLFVGVVTVAVPFASLALIWFGLPRGHSSFYPAPIISLLVILAAVAMRELWEHRFAPVVSRDSA